MARPHKEYATNKYGQAQCTRRWTIRPLRCSAGVWYHVKCDAAIVCVDKPNELDGEPLDH